ncbi:hypothetical protein Tco_0634982 [Tanacetum coccineum]
MINDEMKLTENYRMYAKVFRVDVPTNQSQSIESTQGTHKTTSAPKSPNPDVDEGESRAQRKSTIIRLCIPLRRSTRLTSPTPISTTPIPSVAERGGLRNDGRLDPGSYKESPKVEKTVVVQPVNVIEEEEESAEDDYELRRKVKGKNVEEYVVPTGKDNFIVSAGRPNMVPAGRTIVSPGSIIFGPGELDAWPIRCALESKLTRFHSWISTYIQVIKSRCVNFKLFIVMQLWDKHYIDFKEINEITF